MLTGWLAPASAQICSTPSFTQAPVYPVGEDIRSVAVADLDGDGRPDLAVANADSSSVSVLEHVGLGEPAIINAYTVGPFPLGVVTGDFTGDGKPDIVTANDSATYISLLRNNGSGGFVAAGTFNSGPGVGIVAGDFNNDGKLDVAVATGFSVGILLGDGQGGFDAPISFSGGSNRIIAADFNNDGKLDLAAANTIQIRLGDGTGHFAGASCPIQASGGLAAGDVNGDGKLDLVVANILAAQIQVRLGDGLGCFGTSTNFDDLNFGRPGFAALGDLNNDGKLDIVAGATVLLGNGTGGFGAPFAYGMGSLGADPGANTVIADFDDDGNLDIASASTGSAGILFGDGAGGFRFAVGPAGRGAYSLARADLNGDGKLDVVVTSNGSPIVMLGDGTGKFGAPAIVTVPSSASFVGPVIADFNSDTKLDIAVVDATHSGPGGLPRFHVLPGDGLGGFGSAISTSFDAPDPFSVAGGDLNGDGKTDLVTVNRGGGNNNEGSISISLGDGAGHFIAQPNPSTRTASNPGSVGFADFNSDGKMDLAIPSGFGFSILLGNGTGGFAPRTHITTANASSIRTADLNGDGKADLAMVSEGGDGKVSVVFGDGMGGFSSPSQFNVGAFPSDLAVADLNGDGKPDLAVSNARQDPAPGPLRSGVSVLLGDGMGGFGPASNIPAERSASRIVVGDFNGDTRPDIITANQLVNNLTVSLQMCTGPTPTSTIQFAASLFGVRENAGSVTVTVTRSGNILGAATVDFATSDGAATQTGDYEVASGTLSFAPGETSKTFSVLIVDDLIPIETESFSVTLKNPTGATLGNPKSAIVSINDNDGTFPNTNPLDNADQRFFVRQQFLDFLSREPDQGGFDFWVGQITQCGSDTICIRNRRIDVSNAFFYELEYQQTGSYVYRMYRAAYGNSQPFPNPDSSNPTEANKLPSYSVFAPDRAIVVGGASLTQSQIDFATAFVQRSQFLAKYPSSLDGSSFIDSVLATVKSDLGVDLTGQKSALLNLFNQAGGGNAGRGMVMYRLANDDAQGGNDGIDNRALIDSEYNRAFVATQYFGYLRRDSDIDGFLFWLGQVNGAALRDVARQHAMVCSFITSAEYQLRFSSVVTHTNAECSH
jgi:hypothetical protein